MRNLIIALCLITSFSFQSISDDRNLAHIKAPEKLKDYYLEVIQNRKEVEPKVVLSVLLSENTVLSVGHQSRVNDRTLMSFFLTDIAGKMLNSVKQDGKCDLILRDENNNIIFKVKFEQDLRPANITLADKPNNELTGFSFIVLPINGVDVLKTTYELRKIISVGGVKTNQRANQTSP